MSFRKISKYIINKFKTILDEMKDKENIRDIILQDIDEVKDRISRILINPFLKQFLMYFLIFHSFLLFIFKFLETEEKIESNLCLGKYCFSFLFIFSFILLLLILSLSSNLSKTEQEMKEGMSTNKQLISELYRKLNNQENIHNRDFEILKNFKNRMEANQYILNNNIKNLEEQLNKIKGPVKK